MLKQVPPTTSLEIELADGTRPALIRVGDDYQYLIMPLT